MGCFFFLRVHKDWKLDMCDIYRSFALLITLITDSKALLNQDNTIHYYIPIKQMADNVSGLTNFWDHSEDFQLIHRSLHLPDWAMMQPSLNSLMTHPTNVGSNDLFYQDNTSQYYVSVIQTCFLGWFRRASGIPAVAASNRLSHLAAHLQTAQDLTCTDIPA